MANGFKTGGRDWGKDNPPPKSPGRPRLTLERKAILDHYKHYLENGDAVVDHLTLRKIDPKSALNAAETRTYGKPKEHVELSGSLTLAQIRADLLGQETKE